MITSVGIYLGTTVLLEDDASGGWVTAIFPDNEKPKHGRPLTYKKGERWRLWQDQVTPLLQLPE